MSTETKAWLDAQFVAWSGRQPRRERTVKAFARYLGVSLSTVNNWFNRGQTPEGENVALLARKLGFEIYDIVGIPRPDPLLQIIINGWGDYPDEFRAQIEADVARAEAAKRTGQSDARVAPPDRRRKAGPG